MNRERPGYILFMTLMIVSLALFLVNYIAYRGTSYLSFTKVVIEQEQARILAEGAIQIAISQLQTIGLKEDQKKDDKQPQKKRNWQQKMIFSLYPLLYSYQTLVLSEKNDGIDATIEFCWSSEDAKINLNKLYDFKKKEFINNARKYLQMMCEKIEKRGKGKNLFSSLENFLKKRTFPLEDITELLVIKEFAPFASSLFYEPSVHQVETKKEPQLFLTDIFTIWSKSALIEPWLLTPSLLLLHDMKMEKNEKERVKIIEKQIDLFKAKTTWQTDWNTLLSPLYGVAWQTVPDLVRPFLQTSFEASFFSVMIRVTVGKVKQRLLALLESVSPTSSDDRYQFHVKLRKVYWL